MKFKRYCKTLQLYNDPVLIERYIKAHAKDQVWPEIEQGMNEVGILDMEIYIHGTTLFMIMDTVPDFDHDRAFKELAKKPKQKEWEVLMAQFQKTPEGASADYLGLTFQLTNDLPFNFGTDRVFLLNTIPWVGCFLF